MANWNELLSWARIGALLLFLHPGFIIGGSEGSEPDDAWYQFRGPRVDGTATGSGSAPEGQQLRLAWKVPLGSGYSGVTAVDATLVTAFSAGETDVAAAFDAETGRELWRFPIEPVYIGLDGSFNGPIATPLIADDRVFGLSPRGRLYALDLKDGSLLWDVDLVKEYDAPTPHYGFSTSPLLAGGAIVVQVGAPTASVVGFEPSNGRPKWKAGGDAVGYQTPVPTTIGGRSQILAAGNRQLLGIAPENGEILWKYNHGGGSPRGAQSMVPVPAGEGRIFLKFKDASSAMVQLTVAGGSGSGEQIWQSRSIRNTYSVPVYRDGHLYAFSSRFLTCVNAETGKSVWRSRPPGDGFPMLLGDRLVIVTKQGSLHLAEAEPSGYHELAQLKIFNDLTWTPPGFHKGSFYLRSHGEIARVDFGHELTIADSGAKAPSMGDSEFARFVREAESSSEKGALIDRYLDTQKQFPILEEPDWAHFVYRGSGEDLAIAGDMIGARQEKPMKRIEGTDFFYYSTRLERDARISYIFIRDYQEIVDPHNTRRTKTGVLGRDWEFVYDGSEMAVSWMSMPDWKVPPHLTSPAEGTARGHLEVRRIKSATVKGNISTRVYLPAGYEEGSQRYPVVYLHGGVPARKRGQVPSSLDNLIGRGVAPVIVVFVDAMPVRSPSDYADLWRRELVPHIDRSYRTIASPEARANVGAGFSGYNALWCALKEPGVAGKVAVQSLVMLKTMEFALMEYVRNAEEQPLEIYMDWGKYDLTNPEEAWDLIRTNREFAETLRQRGYQVSGGQVNDGTGWASWKNRTDVVFRTLFPQK